MSVLQIGNAQVYQVFMNGHKVNSIKYGDNENKFPLNQDRIIIKEFWDSEEKFIQLRAVQVIPYTDSGVIDNTRDNKILLFARGKKDEELGYIGAIKVDNNFKISTLQDILDNTTAKNLSEYFGQNLNSLFYLDYSDFGENALVRHMLLKTESKDFIFGKIKQPISNPTNTDTDKEKANYKFEVTGTEAQPTNYNSSVIEIDGIYYYGYFSNDTYYMYNITNVNDSYTLTEGEKTLGNNKYEILQERNTFYFFLQNKQLCLTDIKINKPNNTNEIEQDTWSILYFPYQNDDQLEVFMCAILKNTSTKIYKYKQPYIQLGINQEKINEDEMLSLYDIGENGSYFVAAKSARAKTPTTYSYENNVLQYLNGVGNEDGYWDGEVTEQNLLTWPLENKDYNRIISTDNCYFSLDNDNWYQVQNNIIDLENLGNFIELPTTDYQEFVIVDNSENGTFNNNGNILLRSYNTISILIVNNHDSDNNVKSQLYLRVYGG